MRIITRLFLPLVLAAAAAAQAPETHRFGCVELTFIASREYENPLAENITVEFAAPRGGSERVQAFWDGGRTWKVRFMPEHTGMWRYRVLSGDAALKDQQGVLRVTDYRGRNELYRYGAPRVSADRRYFVTAGGAPWFFLSDTAWNGALMSTRDEWERYLKDRVAKRFTAIQFVTTQWRAGRADERGQVAFTGTDSIRVNPAFFQRMDEKFDQLNAHGLVAVPVLLWALTSREKESPGETLPVEQAALLARYMVARYGAHHVIWFLGGDGDYRGEKADRWKQIGRAVFPQGRRYGPVTLHPRGMQSPWDALKDEPWLDFFLYQSGHGSDAKKWRWNATQGPALDWKMQPARPVVDGEPNYEGHLSYQGQKRIGDYEVRRAAYYSLLGAPPAGITYGAHGIWPWMRERAVPLDHPRTGVADPWFDTVNYPGAKQMKVLRDVFDRFNWWKLRPDAALLAERQEDAEFKRWIQAARAEDGSCALLYLPGNDSLVLNLARFNRKPRAIWIDPRTGKQRNAGRLQAAARVELKPPSAEDWLLLLK